MPAVIRRIHNFQSSYYLNLHIYPINLQFLVVDVKELLSIDCIINLFHLFIEFCLNSDLIAYFVKPFHFFNPYFQFISFQFVNNPCFYNKIQGNYSLVFLLY